MKVLCRIILAGVLLLTLAGAALALPGETWTPRSDGWYAPSKTPLEVKDYGISFSKELAADKLNWQPGDDTIASVVWTYPSGLTGGPDRIGADPRIPSSNDTTLFTWFAGGTAGQKYTITLKIVTTQGRTEEWSFKIEVK
jgi:hypothetical protein